MEAASDWHKRRLVGLCVFEKVIMIIIIMIIVIMIIVIMIIVIMIIVIKSILPAVVIHV